MKTPTQRDPAAFAAEPASGDPAEAGNRSALLSLESELLKDVSVSLKARLGEVALSVKELLELEPGSVLKLETRLSDHVELRLNDSLVAIGEIVAIGENFGVRIVQIAKR